MDDCVRSNLEKFLEFYFYLNVFKCPLRKKNNERKGEKERKRKKKKRKKRKNKERKRKKRPLGAKYCVSQVGDNGPG